MLVRACPLKQICPSDTSFRVLSEEPRLLILFPVREGTAAKSFNRQFQLQNSVDTLEAVNFWNPKGLENILTKFQIAGVKNEHVPAANVITTVFVMMEESNEGFW